MKLFHKKKAAMELSINAIVIVVLAFTLLGLGLVFIRSQFKNIGDTSSQVTEQVKQQILDDLRTGNKRLSFPVTELKLASNEDTLISIGVKNVLSDPLYFKIEIVPVLSSQAQSKFGPGYTANKPIPKADASTDGAFFWDNNLQTLPVGESQVYGIKYRADKGGNTYQYKIVITEIPVKIDAKGVATVDTTKPQTEYSSRAFFVKIS